MSTTVYCRACGAAMDETALACPRCGAPQRPGPEQRNKTVAALLALFLGGIGVHRMYLRQWRAVWYVLFCWTGIPGVVALVEGLVFAFGSQAKWDRKYNNGLPSAGGGVGPVLLVVVAVVMAVALIGILAAIALPAYQNYRSRAQVVRAYQLGLQATARVGGHLAQPGEVPASWAMAGQAPDLPPEVQQLGIDQRSGAVTVTLAGAEPLIGRRLVFVPDRQADGRVRWRCTGDGLPDRLLPAACRTP